MRMGWVDVELGEVASKIQYGFTESSSEKEVGPKFLRITDIQNNRVDWESVPYCKISSSKLPEYLLEEGDLLFARTGATVGKSFLIRGSIPEAVFASYLIRVRIRKNMIDEVYLSYFFHSLFYWKQITEGQVGIGQPNVNGTKLKRLVVPLAPLPEQRRIVSAIELQLGRLDAAVARLHAAKAKLKRYKQAVLHDAYSGDWDTARLDEVCLKIQDGSHFSPQEQFDEPGVGRYIYITSKNIRNGHMDLSKLVYVNKEYFDSIYPRCKPELNDVLLTKDGANTGNVTLNSLDEPYALLSSVCLFKPDRSKLVPAYLMYFIQGPDGFKQLTGKMTGTAIKRIILERIREAPMPLPPVKEQQRIVDHISEHFNSAEEVERTLDAQLAQSTRLRQSVLKRAFEGRLV